MRIGFVVPANYCFANAGGGVRVQADAQADALRALGHAVERLNPWLPFDGHLFDVVHFFSGGFPLFGIQHLHSKIARVLCFAPMIDSTEPNWRYRLAARLGTATSKFYTVPGEIRLQALGADRVICRSRHEQERVVQGLGVAWDKTRVVLNGIAPQPPGDTGLAHALLGSDRPFVLHVSAYCQPRKNVLRLIEAVGPTGIPLVIAGTVDHNDVLQGIKALENRFPNVRRLGFVSMEELNALYAACRVFAMPSVSEGTGLAALEAAAQGAAVVITDRGGTRDYFRDDARYVDPFDTPGIRRAIEAAFAGPPPVGFAARIRTTLTWVDSGRQLIEAYASAGA